jgi:hypothetical protein
MMKRILAAAMLMAATAAFAQVDATEVGPELREEAKEIGSTAKENVKELEQQADVIATDGKTYETDAFEMKGKVERATRERLTLQREGLPQASLDIRNETEVLLDGKKVKASELKEGMDIRAHFQIEGREPVAVKIEAKREAAMGGAGAAGKDDDKNKKWKHKKDN